MVREVEELRAELKLRSIPMQRRAFQDSYVDYLYARADYCVPSQRPIADGRRYCKRSPIHIVVW